MEQLSVMQMEEIEGGSTPVICAAAAVVGGIGIWGAVTLAFAAPEVLAIYGLSLGATAICAM